MSLLENLTLRSPLGPVLANLLMKYRDKIWLGEFKSSEVVLDQRYDDDTIYLFSFEKILMILNFCHPNIKFSF